ncbi:uncharacterized protein Z519_08084 [Cladophialophora bantiana CBS 173.52]|uniref:AB hydrolase-1 domain-containing protein n=1 Tax=Cladophialophora bantiana (strain ATCC 10958 / CBS 173.52 / CDC B-1940 / NIH 8579) TaxID=1442370 RepID=A0A0D2I2Q7_CLAB1|nr:uncharacterized protein Z519_08084 [Cladophialophora bantiana CBS 173.52]KIW91189.1 hypothetical protein Z519_08084 [Cladophialophora bantiana CBS 173.52]
MRQMPFPVLGWVYPLSCFLFPLAAASPQILWTDCRQHVPPRTVFDSTGVDLQDLPSTLKCGQIVVPMDYSRPLSESNNITLGLAMYRPIQPKGIIFFCPGGSDNGVVYAWNAALNITSPFTPDFSGLTDYDLMMMDIRGTYSSNPLNVSLDKVLPLFAPYPTSQAEFENVREIAAAAIQSWVDSNLPHGIIGHVGTREVVQDYNQIRQALGYDQVHFLGASYGSYRALQFAHMYPDSVGRFVLDAVVPHGVQAEDQIVAANRVLLRADAYCQNNSSCPLRDAGKGSVARAYRGIIKAASNSSIDSVWTIQSVISGLFQGQPDFPQVIDLISTLSSNISALEALPEQALTVENIVAYILECGDSRTSQTKTFSEFHKSLNDGLVVKSHLKLDFNRGIRLTELACSAWPFDTASLERLRTELPMLLVTADFDGSAPTEWTTMAMSDIPNSHLVVRHGDDHVSFNLPYQYSAEIENGFLRTGVLPRKSNDSSVTVYAPPMKRGPIADPYSVPTGFWAGDVDSE